jgi:hypothetical protein
MVSLPFGDGRTVDREIDSILGYLKISSQLWPSGPRHGATAKEDPGRGWPSGVVKDLVRAAEYLRGRALQPLLPDSPVLSFVLRPLPLVLVLRPLPRVLDSLSVPPSGHFTWPESY